MENKLKEMLDEECKKTLQAVSEAKAGSEEATTQLEKLTVLHKLRMDEAKLESDKFKEVSSNTRDYAEANSRKWDRWLKFGSEMLSLGVSTAVSCIWLNRGMSFETTGSYTGRTVNWLSSYLKLFHK